MEAIEDLDKTSLSGLLSNLKGEELGTTLSNPELMSPKIKIVELLTSKNRLQRLVILTCAGETMRCTVPVQRLS